MRIAHVSLPADDPQRAAEVLAEIMQGEATPFPPGGPGAWMAWSGDGEIELEIVRRGWPLQLGPEEGAWAPDGSTRRWSESHAAVCVRRPEREIIAIAQAAGWPARHCERGEGYFQLVEVWVDGAFMLEFMDPAQTARYREAVTPSKWKEFLARMEAA
ncbi:MAG: hypothetical protein AB7L65_07210 [Hyphomonadaceae bacterium]